MQIQSIMYSGSNGHASPLLIPPPDSFLDFFLFLWISSQMVMAFFLIFFFGFPEEKNNLLRLQRTHKQAHLICRQFLHKFAKETERSDISHQKLPKKSGHLNIAFSKLNEYIVSVATI